MITIMQLHKCIHRSIVTQLIFIGVVIVLLPPPVYAAVYFMNDGGQQVSELGVADKGQNKGRVVVVGADGQEVTLGVGGSCGLLCTILTAKVENGKAVIGVAVPDVQVADPNARLKIIFADILNAKLFQLAMATPEEAIRSVGMMLGIVSADGVNANIGLVARDRHIDIDNSFKVRISELESGIKELKEKLKEREFECTTKTVQIPLERIFGADPWVVTPSANNPQPNIPSANVPQPNIQPNTTKTTIYSGVM